MPFSDFGDKSFCNRCSGLKCLTVKYEKINSKKSGQAHHDTQFKPLHGKLREKDHDSETKETPALPRKWE